MQPSGLNFKIMDNSKKIILDLCGGTGSWSKPYKKAGYDVCVVTLPEYDITEEKTVRHCIGLNPYGILCAVECKVWSNAGIWYWQQRTPDEVFYYSKLLVKCLRIINSTNPVFHAIENPVGKMREFLGDPEYSFDPCDFGDPWTKKTFLWGKFNQPVKQPVKAKYKNYIRDASSIGGCRRRNRSVTPNGFANAFFKVNQ